MNEIKYHPIFCEKMLKNGQQCYYGENYVMKNPPRTALNLLYLLYDNVLYIILN